jgi:hypothetical protein
LELKCGKGSYLGSLIEVGLAGTDDPDTQNCATLYDMPHTFEEVFDPYFKSNQF